MARPNVLCKLFKGKLIDTFTGFVDTFNYLVDFCENLKGDGDNDASKKIIVDRSVPDRPVIKIKGDVSGGGGNANIKVIGTDESEAIIGDPAAEDFKTLTFASAEDSNVEVKITGDEEGNVTATIGVYYKT